MKKVLIALSIIFMVVGFALSFTALAMHKFDWEELANVKYVVNEYDFEESFTNVEITEISNDIEFYSLDELEDAPIGINCRVVTKNGEKISHEVKVEDNTLIIDTEDKSKWYEFFFGTKSKTKIYVNNLIFDNLKIKATTSDIKISDKFAFNTVEIKTTTGDINLKSAINSLEIETTTGNITLTDINTLNDVSIKVTTGDVILKNITIVDDLIIKATTGDITIKNSQAKNIKINVTTGDVDATLIGQYSFDVDTSTGDKKYPKDSYSLTNKCYVRTTTGDITIKIVE